MTIFMHYIRFKMLPFFQIIVAKCISKRGIEGMHRSLAKQDMLLANVTLDSVPVIEIPVSHFPDKSIIIL
jgi:hypothetical protein